MTIEENTRLAMQAFQESITGERFIGRTFLVGERIDLKTLEHTESLGKNPMTVKVKGGGIAVLFRYGVVTLFNVSAVEEQNFLESIKKFIIQPVTPVEQETETIVLKEDTPKEGIQGNNVTISKITLERLQLIADIFSKNLILSHYESEVSKHFDYIEPLAISLKNTGKGGQRVKELLKHIGGVLLSEHKMVGRVAVTEKPETLWDCADLERFYSMLRDEYEIHDRQIAVERKLDLLSKTLETTIELVHTQHSHRLEWYIVILIVLEIVIFTIYPH